MMVFEKYTSVSGATTLILRSAVAAFFSSLYRSQRHEVLHGRYIRYLSSVCPCKNLVLEQVIQTFVGGILGCLFSG